MEEEEEGSRCPSRHSSSSSSSSASDGDDDYSPDEHPDADEDPETDDEEMPSTSKSSSKGKSWHFQRDGHWKKWAVERPHQCDVCGKCFPFPRYLKAHMKTHVNPCNYCSLVLTTYNALRTHIAREHPKPKANVKCTECSYEHLKLAEVRRHYRKCHFKGDESTPGGGMQCPVPGCSETTSYHRLRPHLERKHGIFRKKSQVKKEEVGGGGRIEDDITVEDGVEGMEGEKEVTGCEECDFRPRTQDDEGWAELEEHRERAHGLGIACPHPDCVAKDVRVRLSELADHVDMEHAEELRLPEFRRSDGGDVVEEGEDENVDGRTGTTPSTSSATTTSKRGIGALRELWRDIRTEQGSSSRNATVDGEEDDDGKTVSEYTECSTREGSTRDSSSIADSGSISLPGSSGRGGRSCKRKVPISDKRWGGSDGRTVSSVTNDSLRRCALSDASSTMATDSSYGDGVEEDGEDEEERRRAKRARIDELSRRPASGSGFICVECGSSYANRDSIRKHIARVHEKRYTESARRTYPCERQDCGKVLKTPGALQDHYNGHDGIRAYKCETCEKTFIARAEYARHLTVYHNTSIKVLTTVGGFLAGQMRSKKEEEEGEEEEEMEKEEEGYQDKEEEKVKEAEAEPQQASDGVQVP